MSAELQETVEVEVAVLRRYADDVVYIEIREGARIDGPSIAQVLGAQEAMTPRMMGVIVDARGAASMTREAMEMTANNPVNDRTAATAIVTASAVSSLLGNFFMRFSPYPCRLFGSPQKARRWVLEHLEGRRE